jgi:hypothetical protein
VDAVERADRDAPRSRLCLRKLNHPHRREG